MPVRVLLASLLRSPPPTRTRFLRQKTSVTSTDAAKPPRRTKSRRVPLPQRVYRNEVKEFPCDRHFRRHHALSPRRLTEIQAVDHSVPPDGFSSRHAKVAVGNCDSMLVQHFLENIAAQTNGRFWPGGEKHRRISEPPRRWPILPSPSQFSFCILSPSPLSPLPSPLLFSDCRPPPLPGPQSSSLAQKLLLNSLWYWCIPIAIARHRRGRKKAIATSPRCCVLFVVK